MKRQTLKDAKIKTGMSKMKKKEIMKKENHI